MADSHVGRSGGFITRGKVTNRKDDPTQTGMVRVQWLTGGASQDQLDDESRPWTKVMQSTTSASLGSRGGPHTGLLEGTEVFGVPIDGSGQDFLVIGTATPSGKDNDQTPKYDSEIPRAAKNENNGGGDNQPKWDDINDIVTQDKWIGDFGEQEGGPTKTASLYPKLNDSFGEETDAIHYGQT